jgi:hypothetical protein
LRHIIGEISSPQLLCGGLVRSAYDDPRVTTSDMARLASFGLMAAAALRKVGGYEDLAKMATSLAVNARSFVRTMYSEKSLAYASGVICKGHAMSACASKAPLSQATMNEPDIWLAMADVDPLRRAMNMKAVLETLWVGNKHPGLKYSAAAHSCSQYETTGSFLCAVSEVCKVDDSNGSLLDHSMQQKISSLYRYLFPLIKAGKGIQSVYEVQNGGSFPDGMLEKGCFSGMGWSYIPEGMHLASTVYCYLAFANMLKRMNPFQFEDYSLPQTIECGIQSFLRLPSCEVIDTIGTRKHFNYPKRDEEDARTKRFFETKQETELIERNKKQEEEMIKKQVEERIKKQEDEMMQKREDERIKKLEEDRIERLQHESIKRQEEERIKKQEDERIKKQEEDGIKKQEGESIKNLEEERIKRQHDETIMMQDEERIKTQDNERIKKQEEDRIKKQEEEHRKKLDGEIIKKRKEESINKQTKNENINESWLGKLQSFVSSIGSIGVYILGGLLLLFLFMYHSV